MIEPVPAGEPDDSSGPLRDFKHVTEPKNKPTLVGAMEMASCSSESYHSPGTHATSPLEATASPPFGASDGFGRSDGFGTAPAGAALQRSKTRGAIAMKDEGSIHDAAAKGKATAQSFSSLMKVTEEKTEAEKEALRVRYNEQTIKYRDQIRRQRRCTLDPHSKWMSRWDMVTTLALLFTATITPFEVCILEAMSLEEMLYDPLAWINRLVTRSSSPTSS